MSAARWRSKVLIRSVAEEGLRLMAASDRPVDVLFGDQRVWSFWVRRDSNPDGLGGVRRHAVWPRPLRRFLDGHTRVSVRDAATGALLWAGPVTFGEATAEIRVVNRDGAALGTDKSGKLVPTFSSRSQADIDALVAATAEVMSLLRRGGVEPFLAYGTLLGAVREGRVLGHDSDADVAYVSGLPNPVDVCRESFRLQRAVHDMGYATSRYSGAAFKVLVPEGDGHLRGLDVFGGFLDGGRLYLMGEVGIDFESEWIHPLGSALIEGVELPVPARPEKLLEAMYGAGWRTPDPAFEFTTPRRTTRALTAWFRGLHPDQRWWERYYSLRQRRELRTTPSRLARMVAQEAATRGADVLDVGAGRGGDAVWLARQGLRVTAYDFVPRGLEEAGRIAAAQGLSLDVRPLSLGDLRSVLGEGTRLALEPGRRRVVVARDLLDATDSNARELFARFCSMALRNGGMAVAEFHPPGTRGSFSWRLRPVDSDTVAAQWRAAGATTVDVQEVGRGVGGPPVVRVVGEWSA